MSGAKTPATRLARLSSVLEGARSMLIIVQNTPDPDAIAAAAVGVMIAKIGWDLLWKSLQELIDTSLEEDKVDAIREAILDVAGVRALHMLRTRRSGSDALVDVHILVDPGLSVSEGHMIGERVRTRLIGEMDDVSDVTVHIDPEDDEVASPCTDLPLRDEIMQRLEEGWAKYSMALL